MGFKIKKKTFKAVRGSPAKEYSYSAFTLNGRLNGKRVRLQFPTRQDAEGERERLEILATNTPETELRAIPTRRGCRCARGG